MSIIMYKYYLFSGKGKKCGFLTEDGNSVITQRWCGNFHFLSCIVHILLKISLQKLFSVNPKFVLGAENTHPRVNLWNGNFCVIKGAVRLVLQQPYLKFFLDLCPDCLQKPVSVYQTKPILDMSPMCVILIL